MFKFNGLESLPLKYAISEKKNGNMSFTWGEAEDVVESRRNFFDKVSLSMNDTVMPLLQHGTEVIQVTQNDKKRGIIDRDNTIDADGLITAEKGLNLSLIVADCVPTIFYENKQKLLALVHINGKNPGIIPETLKKFQESGSKLKDIIVSFGPCILKDSFVVPDPFQKQMPEWNEYIQDVPGGRTSIDMLGFLKNEVAEEGIPREQIFDSGVDTFKEMELFSHRRSVVTGEPEGRFIVVVGMENE